MVTLIKLTQQSIGNFNRQNCFIYPNGLIDQTKIWHLNLRFRFWVIFLQAKHTFSFWKIQQVNLHDPPDRVAVTCRELQYHSNLHKNKSENQVWLSPTHSPSRRFTCCIYKSNLVVIGLQLFEKIIPISHFPPNLTSDDPWPWYMTFDLINTQRNPHFTFDPSLVPIGLQLFKGDPNNENQHFPSNLTSDNPWPLYVTCELINIWKNPYCIFDPCFVVIRLQLFKGDPNNENLTKLEHTYTCDPTPANEVLCGKINFEL